jgi:hypothetical protein
MKGDTRFVSKERGERVRSYRESSGPKEEKTEEREREQERRRMRRGRMISFTTRERRVVTENDVNKKLI